jgi:hypothetical protein
VTAAFLGRRETLGASARMQTPVKAADAAALIARLKAHNHDPGVQAQCCVSLIQSGQLSDERALTFLPAIVGAMRAHPGHAQLQMSGCGALGLSCHAHVPSWRAVR